MLSPPILEPTSTVQASDIDADGDLDLFVGVRVKPFKYGLPVNGYILVNNGNGIFEDNTRKLAPGLKELGMITDAVWSDYDSDGDKDLIVVGEWMPITVFNNHNGRFKNFTLELGLDSTQGWWNSIEEINNGNKIRYVLGNHGLNSMFKASKNKPIEMYVNDFDFNGSIEQIITTYNDEISYPLALRQDIILQLPHLKKKYIRYSNYAKQTIQDIFTEEELYNAIILKAYELRSSVLSFGPDSKFDLKPLPNEAQLAPVYATLSRDYNNDGATDILLGGNLYKVKPEVGIYAGSRGLYLRGDKNGGFKPVSKNESGIDIKGEIRNMSFTNIKGKNSIIITLNSDSLQVYTF